MCKDQLFGVELTNELCLFEGPEGGTGFPLGSILKYKPGFFEPTSYFLRWCSGCIVVYPRLVAKLELKRIVTK